VIQPLKSGQARLDIIGPHPECQGRQGGGGGIFPVVKARLPQAGKVDGTTVVIAPL
jgi:hypothetical protein